MTRRAETPQLVLRRAACCVERQRLGSGRAPRRAETGAIVLEFALIALLSFLLLAGALDLGRGVFLAQSAQSVARTAARELALVPLPFDFSFEDALDDPAVRQRVYDDRWLVIDLDALDNPETLGVETTLDELFASLPLVNRALRPVMFVDLIDLGGGPRRLLRAPGTLLASADPNVEFTVQVPLVLDRDDTTGTETDVEWARVVEEVRSDRSDPSSGPFSVIAPGGSTEPNRGIVALRVNVALQAVGLTAHRPNEEGPFEPNIGNFISADDTGVFGNADGPLDGATPLAALADAVGPYAGASGLGRTFALGQAQAVRPFRRVLSAQAVFRREIVLPSEF